MIEAEEGRCRFGIFDVAVCAVQPVGKQLPIGDWRLAISMAAARVSLITVLVRLWSDQGKP
jgi:hypothetical protein